MTPITLLRRCPLEAPGPEGVPRSPAPLSFRPRTTHHTALSKSRSRPTEGSTELTAKEAGVYDTSAGGSGEYSPLTADIRRNRSFATPRTLS